jgi:hypothetical protein
MIANLAFPAHRLDRLAGTLALPYPRRNQPQPYFGAIVASEDGRELNVCERPFRPPRLDAYVT